MSEPEVAAIVKEFESLGAILSVTPRLDGSLRLSCWRTMEAWEHRARINELLAQHVESSPTRAAEIAKYVNERLKVAPSA